MLVQLAQISERYDQEMRPLFLAGVKAKADVPLAGRMSVYREEKRAVEKYAQNIQLYHDELILRGSGACISNVGLTYSYNAVLHPRLEATSIDMDLRQVIDDLMRLEDCVRATISP